MAVNTRMKKRLVLLSANTENSIITRYEMEMITISKLLLAIRNRQLKIRGRIMRKECLENLTLIKQGYRSEESAGFVLTCISVVVFNTTTVN